MAEPRGDRRELRLLLATIAISIGMLLLLARFRFPEQSARGTGEPASAPLERLAARATYDELAAIMADLERRIAPRLEILRIQPERASGGYVPAPRVTPDRAVVLLAGNEEVVAGASAEAPLVVGRDAVRDIAVVAVPPQPDGVVEPRDATVRPGPRYVAVVEATRQGPAVRPVYVGRTDLLQDPRVNAPMLSVVALQQTVTPGAAIFGLDGRFIGLASDSAGGVTIVPAEALRALALAAQPAPADRGDLGVQVQALSPVLARASGAERGVMVAYVEPRGPAAGILQTGDVIRAVDGIGVTTVAGFGQLAASRQPGKAVTVDAVRQGTAVQVVVRAVEAGVLREPADTEGPGAIFRALRGMGIEVVALEPDGPAARADLRPGDIVLAVDGAPVSEPATLLGEYRGAARGSALLLTLRRGTTHRVVALEKP